MLAAADPNKYEDLASARVCEDTARALPALCGGNSYVRDTSQLKCLDLRPRRQ